MPDAQATPNRVRHHALPRKVNRRFGRRSAAVFFTVLLAQAGFPGYDAMAQAVRSTSARGTRFSGPVAVPGGLGHPAGACQISWSRSGPNLKSSFSGTLSPSIKGKDVQVGSGIPLLPEQGWKAGASAQTFPDESLLPEVVLKLAQDITFETNNPAVPVGQTWSLGADLMDKVQGTLGSRREAPLDEPTPAGVERAVETKSPALKPYSTPPARTRPEIHDVPPSVSSPLLPLVGQGWRFLESLGRRMAKPFQVFPDPERNKQFWNYLLGQALVSIGISFHYSALPKLVAPNKEDSKELGINRAVNWGSQAASSLATGPFINRSSDRNVLVWSYLGRSLLLVAVPVLFFHGVFTTPVFLAIIFASGFLQSMGINAGSVAFNRILGTDQNQYNKANAVSNLVIYAVSFVAPLAAGAFIGIMDVRYGILAGNAMAYGVYAALLFIAAFLYKTFLRLPQDELLQARRELSDYLRLERGMGRGKNAVVGVTSELAEGKTILVVEVKGDPTLVAGVPLEYKGYPVTVVPRRSQLKELAEGFRLIWHDRFLKLTLLCSTLYLFAGDAIVFTALPRYIQDILGAAASAPPGALAAVPILGPLVDGLTSKAGAFGLYLAASALGLGLSTAWMMRKSRHVESGQVAAGVSDALSSLEKQGRWSSILAGLGMLTYWGVFFSPSLWPSVGFMVVGALFMGPAGVIWSSLQQRVLFENHPKNMGKVYSAMFFYQLAVSVLGVLFFGWLMGAVSTAAALWIVCGALSLVAAVDFIEPFLVFPLRGRPKQ